MRGYAAIGLVMPKRAVNVGGCLRAAFNYHAALVVVTGVRYRNQASDTIKAFRHIPFIQCDNLREVVPFDCVPVAVDLLPGARPLPGFTHPERAFYVFGPEDSTLGDAVTSWCKHTIYVPTDRCMNLAATVNVVLYDRMVKRGEAWS